MLTCNNITSVRKHVIKIDNFNLSLFIVASPCLEGKKKNTSNENTQYDANMHSYAGNNGNYDKGAITLNTDVYRCQSSLKSPSLVSWGRMWASHSS